MSERGWFCVRTQSKHEHIAAAQLIRTAGTEVFLPRIKFRRRTRKGSQWFTEALFPNYLFVKMDRARDLKAVSYAAGVIGLVHFGDEYPTVPDEVLAELMAAFGTESLRLVEESFDEGTEVEVASGSMAGMRAVVKRYYPAARRVELLLEFLGSQVAVRVDQDSLVNLTDPRDAAWGEPKKSQ